MVAKDAGVNSRESHFRKGPVPFGDAVQNVAAISGERAADSADIIVEGCAAA